MPARSRGVSECLKSGREIFSLTPGVMRSYAQDRSSRPNCGDLILRSLGILGESQAAPRHFESGFLGRAMFHIAKFCRRRLRRRSSQNGSPIAFGDASYMVRPFSPRSKGSIVLVWLSSHLTVGAVMLLCRPRFSKTSSLCNRYQLRSREDILLRSRQRPRLVCRNESPMCMWCCRAMSQQPYIRRPSLLLTAVA